MRKISKAERMRKNRVAAKNRIKRKFRSKVFKSKKGLKAKGPEGKTIKKRFFIVTYDAQGVSKGVLWFTSPKPSKESKEKYKADYGVKHPLMLPVIQKKRLDALKKRRTKSKRLKR